jgi:hypothetical protein
MYIQVFGGGPKCLTPSLLRFHSSKFQMQLLTFYTLLHPADNSMSILDAAKEQFHAKGQ